MTYIVRYQRATDKHTTYELELPRDDSGAPICTELCTIDGWTYVSLPDGAVLPEQPKQIKPEPVVLDDDLRRQIKTASPHVRLINQRVVAAIRERYSDTDEIKMLRIGAGADYDAYVAHVEACVAKGAAAKAELGL